MADLACTPELAKASPAPPRHALVVRLTHWLTTLCFFALLVTGIEIVISHPRFYWGETGNVLTPALFQLPIPASRRIVKTGYDFVLPDQNGWSRSLHFQAAWLLAFTALLYGTSSLLSGHFRKHLLPTGSDLSAQALSSAISQHLHFRAPTAGDSQSYNVVQRLAYLSVIVVLFPLMIWTGLAMSPGFTAMFPFTVTAFGGQQSARTIHFFLTLSLVLFVLVHVVMVYRAGFTSRMRTMITGRADAIQEQQ